MKEFLLQLLTQLPGYAKALYHWFAGASEFWAAIAGAAVGGLATYFADRKNKKVEVTEAQINALLTAQMVLLSQMNSAVSVLQTLQDKPDSNPFDDFRVPLIFLSERRLNYESFAFLGESSAPELLLELEVAQGHFLFLNSLIEHRARCVKEFLEDPKTEVTKFEMETGEMSVIAGNKFRLYMVKQVSDAVYKAFLRLEAPNTDARNKLFRYIRLHYPSRKPLFTVQEGPPTETARKKQHAHVRSSG